MYIYSHNPKSIGAKRLAEALTAKRIKHEGSKFQGRPNRLVINWGASNLPPIVHPSPIINHPQSVAQASDKLQFFSLLQGEEITPEWTTDIEEAKDFLRSGRRVICRRLLRASGGRGIVIADHEHELVEAPLYVIYKKKKEEYRVHVFRGNVIDVQKKVRRVSHANPNWAIRNHDNGFVYVRYNIDPPTQVFDAALAAMARTTLDFGAVDVIYNAHYRRAYVLEVNTAPGLEGSTVNSYREAFRNENL